MFPSSTVNATGKKEEVGDESEEQDVPKQEVYVLDGGFVKWQEK